MAIPMAAHVNGLLATMGRYGLIHGDGHGDGHGAERLLIHCEAGLGRAPALGLVALMAMGMDAMAAVEAMAKAVPEASPNRLVLRHAEAILGQAIVAHAQLCMDLQAWTCWCSGQGGGAAGGGGRSPMRASLAR
ncbi:hypothetical protein [Methylobacterium sp. J-068]|uniref:hypothetical protein n=1 Tax=Methylobacterium sp. J-068 TaxID=2836649 RepID=UPI001FB8B544|nr:hypothetical protein [Methylobacterium sp. J-068]MCJ2035529.1 hypothetical protein [Methylobacterium sp. J-068]